jgi:hypothetical protein
LKESPKYMVFQEERSIFSEVTVSVILSKKMYMYMCSIPNGFRDRAISLYRRATRHVLIRDAKCIDVDGLIFESVLLRVRGSVTNNSGFWIGWLDLMALLLQLLLITINYNSSQLMTA